MKASGILVNYDFDVACRLAGESFPLPSRLHSFEAGIKLFAIMAYGLSWVAQPASRGQ